MSVRLAWKSAAKSNEKLDATLFLSWMPFRYKVTPIGEWGKSWLPNMGFTHTNTYLRALSLSKAFASLMSFYVDIVSGLYCFHFSSFSILK